MRPAPPTARATDAVLRALAIAGDGAWAVAGRVATGRVARVRARSRLVVDPHRLLVGAYAVTATAFVALRLVGADGWALTNWDLHAYWTTRDGLDYAAARPGATGAFLYSPAFAQAIAPLTAFPWPAFAALWTAIVAGTLLWLAGPWALHLALLPPVGLSVANGQLDLLFAWVALVGLRWPAVWALPILTKVTPGVALVWFAVRREWRQLAIALGCTGAIAAASIALAPDAWLGWIGMLGRGEFPAFGGVLYFLPVPIWIRLPLAVALVAWGARGDRRWVLPVGVLIAMPTIWVNSPTILVALLPLVAAGARSPAARWLRDGR